MHVQKLVQGLTMSAEAEIAVRTWKVGKYIVTLTMPRAKPGTVAASGVEWAPTTPVRLTAAELQEYRKGRNKALSSIARELGINAAVVDL